MIDYRSEPAPFQLFSETLHFFRVETAELPAPRIPGEDLEGVAFFLHCRVYRVVEGLSDGDVDSDSNRKLSLVRVGVDAW